MSDASAFVASVPRNYEKYLGPLFFEPYANDLVSRIDFARTKKVLEIACGTGRVTRHLSQNLAAGAELLATDLNPDMIAEAKRHVTSQNIRWMAADAQDLPFAENEFDLAVCQYGVMFFPDKPKAFSEVRRVLSPGGVFLFNTWDETKNNGLADITQRLMNELFAEDPPDFLKKGPYSFYDPNIIKSMLSEAGFKNIGIEKVSFVSQLDSADDAAAGIIEGSPLFGYLTEREVSISEVKNKLIALINKQYPVRIGLPMQAFVCRAEKA